MSDILITTEQVEITAADGNKPRRLRIVGYTGGRMRVDGYGEIAINLSGLTIPTTLPVLSDHANTIASVIGSGTPSVEAGKLIVIATLASTPAAEAVLQLLASGVALQASLGASPTQRRRLKPNESTTLNGQTVTAGPSGLTIVETSVLKEISVTPLGADSNTSVAISAKKEKSMTTLTTDPTDILAAERQRVGEIEAACGEFKYYAADASHDSVAKIRASALNGEISLTELQAGLMRLQKNNMDLANLRASRPVGPAIGGKSNGGNSADHITASLMIRAGFSAAAEKAFGPQTMEQSRPLHGASLVDLCRAALQIDGRECPSSRGEMIRAALSSGSLPIALGSSADKTLAAAYQQAPASWRSFAAVKSSANFKTQTSIRPNWAGDLRQLPPGGDISHGTFAEETYQWHLDTFAKQFSIDRQDIINDDASVFSDLIPGMARSAARTLNGLVATTILANAGSFFSAPNANFFSGAATNLSATSLATAIQMLRQMKDGEGNLLDLEPAVLLVCPQLEQTALGLLNSTEVQRVGTGDQQPTGNTFKDFALLSVEPRLSDVAFSGSSATGWYLFSNPSNAAVAVCFLDGQETPVIESFGLDHDVNKLAFSFRCYHDFGCALADHRAVIKSKGAA